MVMPVWDHNPFKWPKPPYVMWLLIVINFGVFFWQASAVPGTAEAFHRVAGLMPIAFVGGGPPGALPAPVTLITSMFLHANFMHVFGNMIFLFVFGDDIEEVLGHWRFLGFYLASGIGAGLAFVVSAWGTATILIGASGAVAGVIAAYLLFRPCAKVTVLLGLIPLRIRAYWVIGVWVLLQFFDVVQGTRDGVAYWAHVGGLVTGAVLFVFLRPRGIPLFECATEPPPTPDYHGHLPPPIPPAA